MLSSIHPLGERAKGNRVWLTFGAFVVGAVAGGVVLASVASLVSPLVGRVPIEARAAVLAILAIVAAVIEFRGWALPSWRRQVNEDWLTEYRGWVYGLGFGVQLGLGLATIVTSASTWVAIAGMVLLASWPAAAVAGAVFGLGRGVVVLATLPVTTPDELMSFHRRFEALAPAGRGATGGALVAAAVGAVLVSVL